MDSQNQGAVGKLFLKDLSLGRERGPFLRRVSSQHPFSLLR